jgi:PhoD-like phosphatase
MNTGTRSAHPPQVNRPWRGPRRDGADIFVIRHPHHLSESVLCLPVGHRGNRFELALADPLTPLTCGRLDQRPGWQPVVKVAGTSAAVGHLVLSLTDWAPFEGWEDGPTVALPRLHPDELNKLLQDTGDEELEPCFVPRQEVVHDPQAPGSFAFGSCQYPAGLLDALPAQASLGRLAQRVAAPPGACVGRAPQGVLLLGDQIYADASYGVLDPGARLGEWDRRHDDLLAIPALRTLMRHVPVHTMPDDHEFRDNWEHPRDAADQQRFDRARQSYLQYQRVRTCTGHLLWGPVALGGHEVFMLDARTERDRRHWGSPASERDPHILSTAQREAFEAWLRASAPAPGSAVRPRFVTTSVWPLPRAREPRALADAWSGYPASLKWLLGTLLHARAEGVCLLTGDAHLAGHTRLVLDGAGLTLEVHILHAPALYAPFPFANARPHQFLREETLHWYEGGAPMSCQVRSDLWEAGDGSVQVDMETVNGRWSVSAYFDTTLHPQTICWRV